MEGVNLDPAIAVRATVAVQRMKAAPGQEASPEAIAAAYAKDANAAGGGLTFDAGALAADGLPALGDVSAEEEKAAGTLATALQTASSEPPAPEAVADALARDRGALADAYGALASLTALQQAGKLPAEVLAQYQAQVDSLASRLDKQVWGQLAAAGTPISQSAHDQARLVDLYARVLGRAPDAGGLDYWMKETARLRADGKPDADIAAKLETAFTQSPEYQLIHGGGTYTIQPGDTMQQLATRFGTPAETLDQINGLANGETPPAGSTIKVIGPGVGAAAPPSGAATGPIPSDQLEGSHGGQCVVFVEAQTGHYFPVAAAKQMLDPGMHPGYGVVKQPQPGDVFVMTGGQYGHTGFVKAVNADGTVTVVDSNSKLDERVHVHTYPISSMAGFLRRDPAQQTRHYGG